MSIQKIPEIKIEKVKKSSKVAVIAAIWNQDLTDNMMSECLKTLKEYGLKPVSIRVSGKPIGFGVLTCDNHEQAKARAGFPESIENKGKDSALAVLLSLNEHKKLG